MAETRYGRVAVDNPDSVRDKCAELAETGTRKAHQAAQTILLMAIFEQLVQLNGKTPGM
jgi:hypothetical protein